MILSIAFLDIINIYANLLPNSISGQGVCCKLRRQLVFYTRCDTMCSPLNHNRNPKPSDQQPKWVLHRGMQDWFVCGTWALQGWTSNASDRKPNLMVWMAEHSSRLWFEEDVHGLWCNLFHWFVATHVVVLVRCPINVVCSCGRWWLISSCCYHPCSHLSLAEQFW